MNTKMNAYLARQPIFDKKTQVRAYELIFHNNSREALPSSTQESSCSPRDIVEGFISIGVNTITGSKPVYITFTPALLVEGIATLFPPELLVIKLEENIEPTASILAACQSLFQKGYTLALDVLVYKPELNPLIKLCKIIEFNFLLLEPQEITATLQHLDVRNKQLLADKIESNEAFRQAKDMGFTLFQGSFFCKPARLISKKMAPLKDNYVSLLKEINANSELDFNKLGAIIHGDVALSYMLLFTANSPYYGMRSQINDIPHALAVLGTKEIRRWVYLMALIGLNADKPSELIRTSMIRGMFMEQINRYCKLPYSSESMFLTGLFSLLDVLLEQPMAEALSNIAIAPEVYEALVTKEGRLHTLLNLIISLEHGAWQQTDVLAALFGLSTAQITEVYVEAVQWCNDIPF